MNLHYLGFLLSVVIGLFTTIIGISAVLKPKEMSKKFGIEASGMAIPYIMSTGIRDVFIGLIILVLFYFQHWRELGVGHLCIGIVAIFPAP